MTPETPVTLDYKTFQRFVAAVRKVEAMANDPRQGGRTAPWTYSQVMALSVGTITEGNFPDTVGGGQAQIYHYDHSAGEWQESGEPVDVQNGFPGGDIEDNTVVILSWVDGIWMVVDAACEAKP